MIKFRIYDKFAEKLIYPESPGARYYTLNLSGEVYNYHDGSGGGDYEVKTQGLSLHERLGAGELPQYERGEVKWLRSLGVYALLILALSRFQIMLIVAATTLH